MQRLTLHCRFFTSFFIRGKAELPLIIKLLKKYASLLVKELNCIDDYQRACHG